MLCVGSTPSVPVILGLPHTGVSVLSPSTLLRLPAALYGAGPVLRVVPVFRSSTKARIRLRPRVVSSPASAVQAANGLRAFSRAWCTFSLHGERPRQPEACTHSRRVRRAFSLRISLTSLSDLFVISAEKCNRFLCINFKLYYKATVIKIV